MSPVISPPQGTGSVTSAGIADGSIVNADINSSAGIAASKLAADVATQAELDAVANARVRVLAQSAVAVPYSDTAESALATVTVPAGAMGPNGRLRVTAMWSRNGSGAGNATARVRLGGLAGTQFLGATVSTTNLSFRASAEIANRNSASSQVGNTVQAHGGWGFATSAFVTASIDTTAAVDLVLTGALADEADTITLEGYLVELAYGA